MLSKCCFIVTLKLCECLCFPHPCTKMLPPQGVQSAASVKVTGHQNWDFFFANNKRFVRSRITAPPAADCSFTAGHACLVSCRAASGRNILMMHVFLFLFLFFSSAAIMAQPRHGRNEEESHSPLTGKL